MSVATLDGHACTKARVQIPAWGIHWADVSLAEPHALDVGARVSLKIADQTLVCSVVSGGVFEGRSAYRLVGGAGGWLREIAADSWANDAGVKASTVLQATASKVGETLADLPTTRLGAHYTRPKAVASTVLNQITPQAWYVRADGVTVFGVRPSVPYTGDGTQTRIDPAGSIVEVATEALAGLVPGATLTGTAGTAVDVEWMLDESRLTARLYFSTRGAARDLAGLAAVVAGLFPEIRWSGVFEFRVVTQSGNRLNLQPVRVSDGLHLLERVPVRWPSGFKVTHALGSQVLVAFIGGDPSRPAVVGGEDPDSPGWMPQEIILGGPGALGVVRLGDTVQAGPFAGVTTGSSLRVKSVV